MTGQDHPRKGVRYLGSGEVAALLGISRRTLSRWVESGELTPTWRTAVGQVARWEESDVRRQVAEIQKRHQREPTGDAERPVDDEGPPPG